MSAGTYEKYLYERLLTVNPEIHVHVLLSITFSIFKQSLLQHQMLTTSNHGYKAILLRCSTSTCRAPLPASFVLAILTYALISSSSAGTTTSNYLLGTCISHVLR